MSLTQNIREKCVELGFDLVGFAPARRAVHADRFLEWLEQGHHADMAWLERDPERRADPRVVLEDTRSLIVVGQSYYTEDPPSDIWDDPTRGKVARYAWGRDYHKVMTPRLKRLAAWLDDEVKQELQFRAYVDTGPVLERDFGALAGLGFIGKNSLLITPEYGSYVFLGQMLVNLELDFDEPGDTKGTCGSCTRCLDLCPTHAFPVPYVVDSRKCISYLTIECRQPIEETLRRQMGRWIFGCDECQSVCPWVKQFARPRDEHWLSLDPNHAAPRLDELLGLDDEGFLNRFAGTPLMRPKRRGLLRNAAIAAGNSGCTDLIPALEMALQDSEPQVREHAAWAIDRLQK